MLGPVHWLGQRCNIRSPPMTLSSVETLDPECNPWIWRENQRGMLIGFSYSEIRSLNKNIVKCLKLNAIFRQGTYFFQFFFCFAALQITQSYIFVG